MKFLHAADLHLDSPMRGLLRYEGAPVAEFRSATRRAFTNLVELCVAEQVAALLLAGDVFDGDWRDWSTGLFYAAQLARLRDAGVRVFTVRGNHDAQSHMTRELRLPDNVVDLPTRRPDTVVAEDLGLAIHGQGFATRAVDQDLGKAYPDRIPGLCNVALLHTSLDGREGHAPYAPTTADRLADKGYDYWALGHVHRREIVAQEPWIVFPGNLQGRHARETGAKGATLVTVEDGRITNVEHRALDVVRFGAVAVDASDCVDGDDLLVAIRRALDAELAGAEGRPLAARVTVGGTTRAHAELAADHDRWLQEVRRLGDDLGDPVWIEKVTFATAPPVDLEALRRRDDPLGSFARAAENLAADDAAMLELLPDLEPLLQKLPREAREGPDGLGLDDPSTLRALLFEVERLVLDRLSARELR